MPSQQSAQRFGPVDNGGSGIELKDINDPRGPSSGSPANGADTEPVDVINDERGSAHIDSGWKPWSVVAGSLCLSVATYGLLSSIGLFQTYWKQHQLADYDSTKISWIVSMFGFLDCFVAAPFGILFDSYGSRILLPVGCMVYLAAFLGLAFSSTYGHFMACFTIAGISAAVPTTVAFSVVSHWFYRRRGLAMGIVTTGAAVGGIFFSLVLRALFSSYTWETSILSIFAILSGFAGIGCLLVETRNSSTLDGQTAEELRGWRRCFRSAKFWLLCYMVFVYELVLFVQWGSLPSYAVFAGLGDQFVLLMVYNIGAIFGRTIPPWMADHRLGPLNTTLMMNAFTLLVVVGIWLPAGDRSAPALFLVSTLMGVGTGSFVPLAATCVGTLCDPQDIGTWLGCCYTLISFATLIGNPVSQALLDHLGPKALVAFLALLLGTGLSVGLTLRWLSHGRRWVLKQRI